MAAGRPHANEFYVCSDGQGVPCMDAASVLCDHRPDCPAAQDEKDNVCGRINIYIFCYISGSALDFYPADNAGFFRRSIANCDNSALLVNVCPSD